MRQVKVYLCISVSLEELPKPYKDAIEHFHELEPQLLCLPWPETAIPPVGSRVFSGSMPFGFDDRIVSKHEYHFSSINEEIRVEVYLENKGESCIPSEKLLECFAECGFVFFSYWDMPIKDILNEAGLYHRK